MHEWQPVFLTRLRARTNASHQNFKHHVSCAKDSDMNHPPFFKPLALVCAALVLSGCASQPPRSASSLPPPDTAAADLLREHAAQESQRLLAHQQMLLAEMNKPASALAIAAFAGNAMARLQAFEQSEEFLRRHRQFAGLEVEEEVDEHGLPTGCAGP